MLEFGIERLLCYKAPLREHGMFWHVSMGRWVFYTWNDDVGLWDNCFSMRMCAAYPNTQATLKAVSPCIACNVVGYCTGQHRLHLSTGETSSWLDIKVIDVGMGTWQPTLACAVLACTCHHAYFILVVLGRFDLPPQKCEPVFCTGGLGSRAHCAFDGMWAKSMLANQCMSNTQIPLAPTSTMKDADTSQQSGVVPDTRTATSPLLLSTAQPCQVDTVLVTINDHGEHGSPSPEVPQQDPPSWLWRVPKDCPQVTIPC